MSDDRLRNLPTSIVEEISGKKVELMDDSIFFSGIERAFPICGSKIDWNEVPYMVEEVMENINNPKESLLFIERNIPSKYRFSEVIFIGDSAISCALKLSMPILFEKWDALYVLPQHHYLVPQDFNWCISVTLEGYMNFGYSPLL